MKKERALLINTYQKKEEEEASENDLNELILLADTSGYEIIKTKKERKY